MKSDRKTRRELLPRILGTYRGRRSELDRTPIETLCEEFRYPNGGAPRWETMHTAKTLALSHLSRA